MILFEQRASTILFNLLLDVSKPFLIPANICPVVPLVFLKAGTPFEIVDISPETFCIDEDLVLEKLSRRPEHYAGVLFVRTFGTLRPFEPFFSRIKAISPDLIVIDDSCLCPPRFDGLGESAADALLYSTGYGKFVEMDFGGFAYVRPGLRYKRVQMPFKAEDLKSITEEYKSAFVEKERLRYRDSSWLDARPPQTLFEGYRADVESRVPAVRQHKQRMNETYGPGLPPSAQLGADYQWWRFNIQVPDKQTLLRKIFNAGLFASGHYESITGVFGSGQSPNSDRLASQIVNLFNDAHFDAEKAARVTEIVNQHLVSNGPVG